MKMKRTDLAVEAHRLWRQARKNEELPGVRVITAKEGPFETTVVEITDEEGAAALDKPMGTYISMERVQGGAPFGNRAARYLAGHLRGLLPGEGDVLVVGLGNRAVTPDALGPRTVDGLLVTRHMAKDFAFLRPVSALCPGVSARTGLESMEIVGGVLGRVRPACVVVVDALAAASPERIGAVVQLSDAGIRPGAGVGSCRAAFDRESLGVRVLALGVPTVCDAGGGGRIVTAADIDSIVGSMSKLLARALNLALQPGVRPEEIDEFVL